MKALFCGLGSIGQRHLRNLRSILGDGVEIIAFRQRRESPVLNADMSVREGVDLESLYAIRSYGDLGAALAERPDIAFITNPNSLHVPVALEAARAGCHLFIEKPLSHSMDGVKELASVVAENDLVAFVAYQFRFHPALQRMKEIVETGQLGSLVAAHIVNGEYLPDWHPYEDYRESHPARRELGGGTLRIQTHEIDFALWLFGMPIRVYAVGGQLSYLEVDVEDSVSLLLNCGAPKRLFPVHIHLDYLQRPPQRVSEVVGDAGRLHFDYYASRLTHFDSQMRREVTEHYKDFNRNQMFEDELRHFLGCVEDGSLPSIDLKQGIQGLQISLAAAQSMELGRAISLDHG